MKDYDYEKMAESFNEKHEADKDAEDMEEIMKASAEAGHR